MCDPQNSPERLQSNWWREKRLFAKLIYNADSKIARRARFLDCFQDWLEQDFFKAVWTEIIRQMGLFRCFPMCTKKVWLDPRIPDGAGGPPVVPVFCKKSCFFQFGNYPPKHWSTSRIHRSCRILIRNPSKKWETSSKIASTHLMTSLSRICHARFSHVAHVSPKMAHVSR